MTADLPGEALELRSLVTSGGTPELSLHEVPVPVPGAVLVENQAYIIQVAGAQAAERREHPGDDLISSLVQAEVDGDRLTDSEVAAFFMLLVGAGNDTTRETTSRTMKALTDFPNERAWLLEDFDNRIGTAVEELIRWATPVMTFRRTASRNFELGGQTIVEGEKVVIFYPSGNWDTEAFNHPDRVNLGRNPNLHVSFGGGGLHFCLGARGPGATASHHRRVAPPAPKYSGRRSGVRTGQIHSRHPQHALHLLAARGSAPARATQSASHRPWSKAQSPSANSRVAQFLEKTSRSEGKGLQTFWNLMSDGGAWYSAYREHHAN